MKSPYIAQWLFVVIICLGCFWLRSHEVGNILFCASEATSEASCANELRLPVQLVGAFVNLALSALSIHYLLHARQLPQER